MESIRYLKKLTEEIHTCVLATVDDGGFPVTSAVDMMDADESGVFFLTAKGKGLYDRLVKRGVVALTGMKGEDTMHCVAISLRGKVREEGRFLLLRLFEKNPYMKEIYPDEKSRCTLTVFRIYEGTGEFFDLSVKPIRRRSFSFGGAESRSEGFSITDSCTLCGRCLSSCPQKCMGLGADKAFILQENCLHCGACMDVCSSGAVVRRV